MTLQVNGYEVDVPGLAPVGCDAVSKRVFPTSARTSEAMGT
jgi:hypothetical protein